ncbi:TrmH family RNA methyltransferase [Roseomonas rosulenta]|uniref:TrmH family RNA methyltransferase n=1 Tax=Roseomonas rosulenta TaxID=2748667 RepID=UPI0018DF91FE
MTRAADLDRHCGPAAVAAVFAHRPQDVMRLFHTAERRREAGPHCAALARLRRPYREVVAADLARIAGTQHHGGIVALALPRAVPAIDTRDLPEAVRSARVTPVLDGIGNPHNLGAIARSAAFFGCRAMVLSGDPRQAGLSDAAFRTAEGGLEALELYRAADLPLLLRALPAGIVSVAAVARGGAPPAAVPRGAPVLLVLGNEESGLAAPTIAACALRVTLPPTGPVESLNVSVAAAVLIHALST